MNKKTDTMKKTKSIAGNFFRSSSSHVKLFVKKTSSKVSLFWATFVPSRLSVNDQTFFAKRLSFLINSGMPILESIQVVRDQTKARRYGSILDKVIHDVSNGTQLSKSLARFPTMFGNFAVNIIRVGEQSGTLSQNLNYLAEELKKKQVLKRKVVGAVIYPAIITLATFGITLFLILYLFPKIMPIFLSMRMKLPFSTRMVIALTSLLQHYGLIIFAILLSFGMGFLFALKKHPPFHLTFHTLLLRLPIVSTMVQSYNLANSTRALGLLLKSGIPLGSALSTVSETSRNPLYREKWAAMEEAVNRGQRISLSASKSALLFPHLFIQMISVGEKSGNLSETLLYLADFYEREMDDFSKNLSSLLEPGLMVLMGLLIGIIAVSIITPIYGITQNLHP